MIEKLKNSRSLRLRVIGQRQDGLAVLRRRHAIRESAVRRHHRRADAVREREIHAVVNRVVERQTRRVRADSLVVIPAHRDVGQGRHGGTGIGAFDLTLPSLAP